MKSKEDKSEVDKLLPVPVDLSKLSGVEENDVINKRYKNAMIKMIKCRKIKDKMLRSKVSKINTQYYQHSYYYRSYFCWK